MRRFLIAFLLLLLVYGALVFALPETTVSPGDLLRGHQEIASDCLACHALFRGTTVARCLSCHTLEEIGVVTTRGEPLPTEGRLRFHDALVDPECMACHTDHRGSDTAAATLDFSHELLEGSVQAACVHCHDRQRPSDLLHRDAGDECGSCHRSEAWTPATFEHDRYFRFDRHHPADCRSCHPRALSEYTCYECHEHSRSNMVHEHREEGIDSFEACVECHRSGDEHEAKRMWRSQSDGRRDGDGRGRGRGRHRGGHDDDDDDDDD